MTGPPTESDFSQLRLFLEELCCDLCRFDAVESLGVRAEDVQIDREFYLGVPGNFADIRVVPRGHAAYFVEVKYGYGNERLVQHLRRKYGQASGPQDGAARVIVLVDAAGRADWPRLRADLATALRPDLALEVWDEERLFKVLHDRFGAEIRSISEDGLLDARAAVDRAKGYHAFGGTSLVGHDNDPIQAELLWHFGFWRLRGLRGDGARPSRDFFPPGLYKNVVVVLADLCSFSSYVRDTRDDAIVRHCLTSFYSKARYQVINNGGMLYAFVGDQAIGLFGLPDSPPDALDRALATAKSLVSIGYSVSNHWQRHIDRVQMAGGLHVGMAVGDLQFVAYRPFSRTHMGAIGDAINVASRLMSAAGPGDVVVSNSLYNQLPDVERAGFRELEPVEARNIGLIRGWRLGLQPG
jgi:adenylate cyclase